MSKKEFNAPTPDESMYENGGYVPAPVPETYGTVTNCERLNIRREPKKKNSEILCVVDKGAKLLINKTKSTIMWYAVTTETGIEGFCMKDFVKV